MYWKIPLAFDQGEIPIRTVQKNLCQATYNLTEKHTNGTKNKKKLIPVKQPPTNIQE